NPHRIATLSNCNLPETVKGLRSFLGAYKVLARVLPGCAQILSPLEDSIGGLQSQEKIPWTHDLKEHFFKAQVTLKENKSIMLPTPDDQLWIVTDGATRGRGVGATMYIVRNNKTILSSFFSSKLRKHQSNWLP
ncbi:hypothetical protein ScPMuIL_002278, partial [Solemya velum]